MRENLPDVWKRANRVLAMVRQAVVERFSRQYRYELGTELIENARATVRWARKAALDNTSRKREKIQILSDAIDELKDSMVQAEELGAFSSTREFEAIAREIRDLGRRCGGWLKSPNGKDQSEPAAIPAGQRVQTLSARNASQGANP